MSDITDIVSRLRRTDENRGVPICSEAADTIEQLRKERDDAREQEERFSDDALRLMEERNAAEKRIAELERDAEIKYENHKRIVATLTAERDEARRLLKSVVNMMRENMVPDATHPKHLCDFIHRPDIAMCKVCEDWTDAMVLCYPDDFQDEEETK